MKILVIPDLQIKMGVPMKHLYWIGRYIVDKRPDIILQIGDLADMESLSSYDVGKKSFEGRQYTKDINAAVEGQTILLGPLFHLQQRQKENKKKAYSPKQILLIGNHEQRIDRAIENDRKLEGLVSIKDLRFEEFGWEVHPFLEVVIIEGVAFSHYFVTGAAGRPASTASAQLNKQHMSCIAGHQQGFQMATGKKADGTLLTSIIAGSCYLHTEEFMGQQGNKHWRGCLMLHNVSNGSFDLVQIPLHYLEKKYG